MALYVIGDLHLSFGADKPMDVFGDNWLNHHEKIKADWLSKVTPEDVVIIPGDISWAMSFEAAHVDLSWIEALPGRKVCFKGNHDYWWSTQSKMAGKYATIEFVHNAFAVYEGIALCGTRGWLCPNEVKFDEDDLRIYKREILRLENSILAAKKAGYNNIYGILHYPPTNDKKHPSGFTEIFEKHGVKEVVYGHIHAKANFKYGLNQVFNGVSYHLTSCDFLEFSLFRWL